MSIRTTGLALALAFMAAAAQAQTFGVTLRTQNAGAPVERIRVETGVATGQVLFTNSFLIVDNQQTIRFREASGGGTNYAAVRAPAALGADYTLTLPVDDGTAGQILSTDGAGALSWIAAAGGGTVTSVGAGAPGANTAGSGLTFSVNPIIAAGTIALANTAVVPGAYTNSSITVDAQGRLTAAASGAAPVTSVTATAPIASSGGAAPNISLTGIVAAANGGTGIDTSAAPSGSVLRRNGAVWETLPIGAAGQVLTVSGGLPTWAAAGGGSAFSAITTATNTTAIMTVGAGAQIIAGGGVVQASEFIGAGSTTFAVDLATAEAAGILTAAKGGTGIDTSAAPSGSVLRRNGAVWETLPIGAAGQVLTVSGGLPTWAAAGGGSAFSAITTATNTTAVMTVGAGASIVAGGGIIQATEFLGAGSTTTAVDLATAETAGILTSAKGGTGLNTSATPTGSIFFTSAIGTWSTLAAGAAGNVLTMAGGVPTWAPGGGAGVTTLDYGAGPLGGALTLPTDGSSTNYVQSQGAVAQPGDSWVAGVHNAGPAVVAVGHGGAVGSLPVATFDAGNAGWWTEAVPGGTLKAGIEAITNQGFNGSEVAVGLMALNTSPGPGAPGIGLWSYGGTGPTAVLAGFDMGSQSVSNTIGVLGYATSSAFFEERAGLVSRFIDSTGADAEIDVGHTDGFLNDDKVVQTLGFGAAMGAGFNTRKGVVIGRAPESPEDWFFDLGSGQLKNGRAVIVLDPLVQDVIDDDPNFPRRYFITPTAEGMGTLVVLKRSDGFEVVSEGGTNKNGTFDWTVWGNWPMYKGRRFQPQATYGNPKALKQLDVSLAAYAATGGRPPEKKQPTMTQAEALKKRDALIREWEAKTGMTWWYDKSPNGQRPEMSDK